MSNSGTERAWMSAGRRILPQIGSGQDFEAVDIAPSFPEYASATNAQDSVMELVRPILMGDECLIITGYQDFLSALSIIMQVRPGITYAEPDTIRLLFGTNTDNLPHLTGRRRRLPEHVRRHYTSQKGVFVRDTRDLRAIQARGAIKSGAIRIRVFDEALAEQDLGDFPGMMHGKLLLSEDFAATGSANFSRRGLASNLEFTDRALGGSAPHQARRDAGERFWGWGVDWTEVALEMLDGLVRRSSPDEAVRRMCDEFRSFRPWQANGGKARDQSARALSEDEARLAYEASGSVYEYGMAYVVAGRRCSTPSIGGAVGSIVADMYERCVMRDDSGEHRRRGAGVLVESERQIDWRLAQGAILAESQVDEAHEAGALDASASVVVGQAHRGRPRSVCGSGERGLLYRGAPVWTTGLAPQLASGLEVEGLASLHEGCASLFASRQMSSELEEAESEARKASAGKPTKPRMRALDAAGARMADALSPMLCSLPAPEPGAAAKVATVSVSIKDQEAAVALVETLTLGLERGGVDVARQAAAGRAVLLARCSPEAALIQWREHLSGTFGSTQVLPEISGSQGMLPIAGGFGGAEEAPGADLVEEALTSEAMAALHRRRLEALAAEARTLRRLIICCVDASAADHMAFDLSDAGIVDVRRMSSSLAAGEGRVRFLRGDRDLSAWLDPAPSMAAADRGVLVASWRELCERDLAGADALFVISPPEDLRDASAVLLLAQEEEIDLLALDDCGLRLPLDEKAGDLAISGALRFGGRAAPIASLDPSRLMRLVLEQGAAPRRGGLFSLLDRLAIGSGHGDDPKTGSANPPWGADFAVLDAVDTPFTAYFLAGQTGRRGETFMPPRLVVVAKGDDPAQELVIRNQSLAVTLVEQAYQATIEAGRASSTATTAERTRALESMSRHLANLSHWDLRPERIVGLLQSLAEFLEERDMPCEGASLMGDLSLPSLELLADRWAECLGPSWTHAKGEGEGDARVRQEDFRRLSLELAVDRFGQRPSWQLDEVRSELRELFEDLLFSDRDKPRTLQDRVGLIIRAVGRKPRPQAD